MCPIPPKALLDKYKADTSKKKNPVDPNQSPIDRMTVAKLKEALGALNLPKNGLKAVLVKRLNEHEQQEILTTQPENALQNESLVQQSIENTITDWELV